MGNWSNILQEIQGTKSQFDVVRKKYLELLSSITGRNIIAYYSSWLTKANVPNLDISDADITGFMTAINGLDCSKGLDLILHTPGGDPAASEAIVNYLRTKFNNDIRIIVPQLAMSAGTMIACSGKEIIMGKQSSLGPIDPQFGGIPAYNIKREFEDAKQDLAAHPENANYWAIKLQQYPAAFMKTAIDAIELSSELVRNWLGSCMFDKRCFQYNFNASACKQFGLNIRMMEDDNKLQDAILSLHHSYMITFDSTLAVKIIENQSGVALISSLQAN